MEEEIGLAIKEGCIGISWTFNEPPLWREYTIDSAKLAKANGLYTNYVMKVLLQRSHLI